MNQPIPNDDAKIVNAQPANHTQGKCFKPWAVIPFILPGYVAFGYFDKEAD